MSPDTQERPPHIPRDWWYRATWHARQRAIDTYHARIKELRATVESAKAEHDALYPQPEPEPEPDTRTSTERIIDTIEDMLTWTADPQLIVNELGMKVGTIEMRMRRANRPDLARVFSGLRNAHRYKPCPDCGKNVTHTSERCRPCAFRAAKRYAA